MTGYRGARRTELAMFVALATTVITFQSLMFFHPAFTLYYEQKGGDDDPTFQHWQEPMPPQQHSHVGSSLERRMDGIDGIADATGSAHHAAGTGVSSSWRRPSPPHGREGGAVVSGLLQQAIGTISEMSLPGFGDGLAGQGVGGGGSGGSGGDGDPEEEGDDVSLAGLTLASVDSMQYSIDSG